jgi:transposase
MARRQVCRDLEIAKSTLSLWESQVDADVRGFTMPSDVGGQREVKAALKRIRELEQENEILRRAAEYLSQANLRNPK